VLLHSAQIHGVDDRVAVLVGKAGRGLQLQLDLVDQADLGVEVGTHGELRPRGVKAALLHEAKRIDARAGADGGEEQVERGGRRLAAAATSGLIGLDRELAIVCVDSLAAWEVDLHVHDWSFSLGSVGLALAVIVCARTL
jgi:hypothetical protein